VRIGVDPSAWPIVDDLARLGATDYLMYALDLDEKPAVAVSWSTDRPGGFGESDLAALHEVRVALAAVLEIHARREIASTVVRTYLGRDAGDRVLAGLIKRGDGETVRAALWFSDLREFTSLSDRLGRDALLALLDDAFEAQVGAIEDAGGTVLKFMGDGLLAIFAAGDDEAAACRSALAAARDAAGRVARANVRREADGAPPIRYGLALHFGDVQFGNIGSPQRLDFTVIGPAVNRAARLEAVCAVLGRACVLSADFAARCGEPVASLGQATLKGVAEAVEVFGLERA
jgi:adenylate cyclase